MPSMLERLRTALAPDYEVERELATGGMGTIFLARDVQLDRRVAIKILKPELATAHAAERFVREARILASFSHPNVVHVHSAGQAEGLFYYVMDHVEGETLKQRLARGPMPAEEVTKLGDDLLAALEAVHAHGVIHRDVKPSNVFLLGDRALLGDFGIAKRLGGSSPGLTTPGGQIGTPDYMPPEQVRGDVDKRTDLYAVGMVLYEAMTVRKWSILNSTGEVDWSGVPRRLVHVLLRALEWSPRDRWRDAASFRRALERTAAARPWPTRRATAFFVSGLAAAVLIAVALSRLGGAPALARAPLPFELQPCPCAISAFNAGGTADGELADAVTEAVVQALWGGEFPGAAAADAVGASGRAVTVLGGEVAVSGDSVWIRAGTVVVPSGSKPLSALVRGPLRSWPSMVDDLARQLLVGMWNANPEATWLPSRTLPQTTQGLVAWLRAERFYRAAAWDQAYEKLVEAEEIDPTCWVCSLRISDVDHWVGRRADPRREERYLARLDALPPGYPTVIRARILPLRSSLAALRQATEQHPNFYFAWFWRGHEVFHRGPLTGDRRRDAEDLFQRATLWRSDYAPAWELLAWVRMIEGDSAGAAEALETYERLAPFRDIVGIRTQLKVGFAWRFLDDTTAAGITGQYLSDPTIRANPNLATGARYLVYFDAPRGAIWLGKRLQEDPIGPDFEASGLLAQLFGYVALGQLGSAEAAAGSLRQLSEQDLGLFTAELDAALALFDADSTELSQRWPSLEGSLGRYTKPGVGAEDARRRAAWILTLVSRRAGEGEAGANYQDIVEGETGLAAILDAERYAAAGRLDQALEISDRLHAFEVAWEVPDPFFRTVLHLLRAEWHERGNDVEGALRDLRWHANNDLKGNPTGPPQPAEVDWAFGTLARWHRAQLLDRLGEMGEEVCGAYSAVARLWADGDPKYAARADTARQRVSALGCRSEQRSFARR